MIPAILTALALSARLGDLSQYPDVRQYNDLPREVRVFIDRRMGCNHFAGEDAYDKDRAKALNAAFRDLKCVRLERDERELNRRYGAAPRVLKALAETRDSTW
jgi:hypothetical protein